MVEFFEPILLSICSRNYRFVDWHVVVKKQSPFAGLAFALLRDCSILFFYGARIMSISFCSLLMLQPVIVIPSNSYDVASTTVPIDVWA